MSETDKEYRRKIGQRIREVRLIRKMQVREFAAAIDMSIMSIYNIERGNSGPSIYVFRDVCRVLKIDANYLMGRKRKQKNESTPLELELGP